MCIKVSSKHRRFRLVQKANSWSGKNVALCTDELHDCQSEISVTLNCEYRPLITGQTLPKGSEIILAATRQTPFKGNEK